MFSEEGQVFAALHGGADKSGGQRFRSWLAAWQTETGERLEV